MARKKIFALTIVALVVSAAALAEGAKKKPKSPDVSSIALPPLAEIPTADGISPPAAERLAPEPSAPSSAVYSVTKIQHAKSFLLSRLGPLPVGGAIDQVHLGGKPPSFEKFSTAVRVKSPQKVNAMIEVLVLDPRGDVAMSAAGELRFRGAKGDEVDYVVDWDAVPCRWAGDFLVAVRVAGQPMGTWPLKVVEPNAGLGNTSARKL
jgi:hypothetical protein